MVNYIHLDFLKSENAYRAAEEFWRALVEKLAARHGQSGQWVAWQDRRFKDGTPEPLDGNPIFEARSQLLGRAVRIIQQEPERTELEVAAWMDTFDFSESGGPGFTEELIVNLSLSVEAAGIAEALIDCWMDKAVSRERMEDLIIEMIRSASQHLQGDA